jgi:hypothetical protein
VRERIAQRQDVAKRLAAALEARNYDQVQAYYKDGAPGGDAAPLVLYANSPAGKGHVRVTLGIDASMVVEVDGVAEGEEVVCLDVLDAFARATAADGDQLVIDDYGRARESASERDRERRREPEPQRLRQQDREQRKRSDDVGRETPPSKESRG